MARMARILLSMTAFGMASNLALINSDNLMAARIFYTAFSVSIDYILLALYFFSYIYIMGEKVKRTRAFNFVLIASLIDTISFIGNVFLHNAVDLREETLFTGEKAFGIAYYGPHYYIHLIICYIIAAQVGWCYIHAIKNSASIYRKKYLRILISFGIILLVDMICVGLKVPLNGGLVAYGVMGFFVVYYAFFRQPKELLQKMQSLVIETFDTGTVCFDDRGKCVYANNQLWELLGTEPDIDAIEKYNEERCKQFDDDQAEHHWQQVIEVYGEKRHFDISSIYIYDEKKRFAGSYLTLIDRTEEIRAKEREIQIANDANKSKSEFLSRISHDIRTPVHTVYGMNEMILRECEDEQIREYAQNIKEASDLLIELINQVMDFSKIEAGKMELVNRSYELDVILRRLKTMIGLQAKKKDLEFICDIDEHLPAILLGDDVRLEQIIMNLLTNAVKYTEKGRVILSIHGEKTEDDEYYLQVSVKDTGIGIRERDIPRMFDAFERFEETRNHSIEGSGLGLNITSFFLKLMDSSLEVDSTYGKGSVFSFKVKQRVLLWAMDHANSETGKDSKAKETEVSEETMSLLRGKILLVDDATMNRVVFKALLKKTQLDITEAENGERCLELVKEQRFDLIFMDHMMPGLDGIETYEAMKSMEENQNQGVPVVMLTANVISGAREEFNKAGFDDFLAKPIMPNELNKTLVRYLSTQMD